jgi:hypothetical protein
VAVHVGFVDTDLTARLDAAKVSAATVAIPRSMRSKPANRRPWLMTSAAG